MATKMEAIRSTRFTISITTGGFARVAVAFRDWFRAGQLGPTSAAEMRRYTGAR
ncbi:MAG: hypothetical protein ACRDLB_06080 [Actinomycetota bacterium]